MKMKTSTKTDTPMSESQKQYMTTLKRKHLLIHIYQFIVIFGNLFTVPICVVARP